MNHIEAAEEFIRKHFKDSIFVLVAGSVIRGEATSTSDLDIFIIRNDIHKAYRESFFESGWPIEAFIHTIDSYKDYFMGDIKRRRPSLQNNRMKHNINNHSRSGGCGMQIKQTKEHELKN